MKVETEMTLRSVLSMDRSVAFEDIQRAIGFLYDGESAVSAWKPVEIVKGSVAMKMLNITRNALNYYYKKGYLERVYAPNGRNALGVTKKSVEDFQRRRVGRRMS